MAHSPQSAIVLPPWAGDVLRVLEGHGEAWAVGGFVRDSLLGRSVHDVDLACSLPAEQSAQVLEQNGFRVIPTGIKHGTVTALIDGHAMEITTFRTDGVYADGRHPETISPATTMEADLARRDFTINALAWHPQRGLLDPFGGQEDLRDHLIRAVGVPDVRFQEDALRVLRALRFSAELGFTIESGTAEALERHADRMTLLSGERIAAELTKLICGAHASDVLMTYPRVPSPIIPEIAACVACPQVTPYHCYGVWEHIVRTLEQVPPEPLVRWAALLHDMGKPAVHDISTGRSHFYGHGKASEAIAIRVAAELHFPKAFTRDLALLVRHHDDEIRPQKQAVAKYLRKEGWNPDLFRTLCQLKIGDALAHAPEFRGRASQARELLDVLDEVLADGEPLTRRDMAISGDDLKARGHEPGPQMGAVLDALFDRVCDGKVANDAQALLDLAEELYRQSEIPAPPTPDTRPEA